MADPERPIFCIGCTHVGGTYGDDVSIFAKENHIIPGFIAKEFIVHRSVANIYHNGEIGKNGLAALYHAVETLDAPYVVIVGHTNCEAIQQSINNLVPPPPADRTPVDDWLAPLTGYAARRDITDADVLAEENVRLQIVDVILDAPNAKYHAREGQQQQPTKNARAPIKKSPLVLGVLYDETTKEWREVLY